MSEAFKDIKISVIIPVYNMEKFLYECLDTVVSQTLKEIEIICIDDGSTDNSQSMILQYAQKDSRIKLVTQENQGAASARNHGLRVATGEFVSFMDPDDWYPYDNTLELLYQKAKEHGVKICGGSLMEYKDGTITTQFSGYKQKSTFKEEKIINYVDYQYDYNYQRFIFDLKFLKENNIDFPNYRRYQDPPFFVRAMATAQKFYAVTECTYKYRVEAQVINWTDIKLLHLLCGLRDNIKLSDEMNLTLLHCECVKRLRNNYLSWFEKRIDNLTDEIICVLIEIGKSINIDFAEYLSAYRKEICTIADAAYQIKLLKTSRHNPEIEKEINNIKNILPDEDEKKVSYHIKTAYEKLRLKNYDAETIMVKQSNLSTTPDVSVIIPVFNVEKYLSQCLDSIISQTYDNYEIICINDGSTDNSLKILEEYADKDSRISVYTHPNMGLSETRNCGVRAAKGKYIYFMDSDDLLDSDAIKLLFEKAESNNLDIIYFDANSFSDSDECTEQVETFRNYYTRKGTYSDGAYKGVDLLSEFEKNHEYRTSACLQMLRKDFFEENSLWFAKGILHEDNLFTFSCLVSAQRAGYLNKSLFNRRIREASIMTSQMSFFNVYGLFYSYIKMNELIEQNPSFKKNNDILNVLYRQLDHAKNMFADLSEEEQYSFYALEEYMRTLFKLYISDSINYRKERNEALGKLKTAWAEKSEINRKLQLTYKEKSEINRKLQLTYKEKSEINRKLKLTYKEKSEINRSLKEAKKINKQSKKIIKNLDKELQKKDAQIAQMQFDLNHPLRYLVKQILRFLHLKK